MMSNFDVHQRLLREIHDNPAPLARTDIFLHQSTLFKFII